MKVLLTAILFIFSISTSLSQSSCIAINETDPFTKKKKIETKQISLTSSGLLKDIILAKNYSTDMFFGIKNDSLIVAFNSKCEDCHTKEYKKIMIIFSNDSIITINNLVAEVSYGEKTPLFNKVDYFQKSYNHINIDDLKLYQHHTIKKIRLETVSGHSFDYDLKEKKAKQIIEIANCIEKYISEK